METPRQVKLQESIMGCAPSLEWLCQNTNISSSLTTAASSPVMCVANAIRKLLGHSLPTPLVQIIRRNYWFPELRVRL